MNITDIITQVRASVDEMADGNKDFIDDNIEAIIRAKVCDAMRWVCMYCNGTLLGGSGGCISSLSGTGEIDLGSDCMRVLRVKGSDWSRAILKPVAEDSEEYMMQNDINYPEAKATKERPLAVIVEGSTTRILAYPSRSNVTVEYVKMPQVTTTATSVNVPLKAESAFVYYLAYLVMIAFNDTGKANTMLTTAKMHAGITG